MITVTTVGFLNASPGTTLGMITFLCCVLSFGLLMEIFQQLPAEGSLQRNKGCFAGEKRDLFREVCSRKPAEQKAGWEKMAKQLFRILYGSYTVL